MRLRILAAATLGLVVLFAALAVRRTDGFRDDVNAVTANGEDWLLYKQNAVSIVDGGLRMPAVAGNYQLPAGFLYNYFVAAIFILTRVNSSFVYIAQAVLLALSVGVMTAAFRGRLRARALWGFGTTLAATEYVDVFRYYTFKLLSENLLLFCLAVWWLVLVITIERGSSGAWLAAGAVLGVCALTRPNLMPFGLAVAALLWCCRRRYSLAPAAALWFAAGFAVTASALLARNAIVTGHVDPSVLTYSGYWVHPPAGLAASGGFYLRRALYPIGFLPLVSAAYAIRPHWIAAWCGAIAFCALSWRRQIELWELVVLTFIVVYLAPLVLLAEITNYGYRMIVPVIPAVLLLAWRAVDLRMAEG